MERYNGLVDPPVHILIVVPFNNHASTGMSGNRIEASHSRHCVMCGSGFFKRTAPHCCQWLQGRMQDFGEGGGST